MKYPVKVTFQYSVNIIAIKFGFNYFKISLKYIYKTGTKDTEYIDKLGSYAIIFTQMSEKQFNGFDNCRSSMRNTKLWPTSKSTRLLPRKNKIIGCVTISHN